MCQVTVRDLETGDVETVTLPLDTYLLIATGDCRIAGMQVWGNGTRQITLKGCRAEGAERAPASCRSRRGTRGTGSRRPPTGGGSPERLPEDRSSTGREGVPGA